MSLLYEYKNYFYDFSNMNVPIQGKFIKSLAIPKATYSPRFYHYPASNLKNFRVPLEQQ